MAEYRPLTLTELNTTLFHSFQRRQVVTDCWRRVEGKWVIQPDPFIDDWTPEDYAFLVDCLKNTLSTGGMVYGAFIDGALKGFTSVEGKPLGSRGQYLDLTSIHVSRDARGHGIGKALFALAKEFARDRGAEKLYISAHSAVETQADRKSVV